MTNSKKMRKIALVGSSTVLMMASHTARAEDQLIQEVIVTAQKRQENLQTTPISISAFTADNLKARGITDFMGVMRLHGEAQGQCGDADQAEST